MLRIDSLSKHYPAVKAVDRVSLEIPKGQMVGVIGRSGAGKSTLLRLINRLVDPMAGDLVYDGTSITALSGRDLVPFPATLEHDPDGR